MSAPRLARHNDYIETTQQERSVMELVVMIRRNIHCWGQYAALRNAKKRNLPFVCAYVAVFNRLPKR